jgi:hypothetical protein
MQIFLEKGFSCRSKQTPTPLFFPTPNTKPCENPCHQTGEKQTALIFLHTALVFLGCNHNSTRRKFKTGLKQKITALILALDNPRHDLIRTHVAEPSHDVQPREPPVRPAHAQVLHRHCIKIGLLHTHRKKATTPSNNSQLHQNTSNPTNPKP